MGISIWLYLSGPCRAWDLCAFGGLIALFDFYLA